MPRRMKRRLKLEETEPLALIVNLFDCGIVFALGLMLIVISQRGATPVDEDSESLEHFRATGDQGRGPGERLGTAYRLPNGDVVFVPE